MTIDPNCNNCNYNNLTQKPAAPIIPGTNYKIDLESYEIPDNLLDYFIDALVKRGLETTVISPNKKRLSMFFDRHRNGDYTNGSLLLAFCIIIESSFKTKDYRVPIISIFKDHLERSGYADGGNVITDVFFLEVF